MVIDEYGSLEGIVTQTDLLEAIAGDLPDMENEGPDIVERADGSLLIEGMMPAYDAFKGLACAGVPKTAISTPSPALRFTNSAISLRSARASHSMAGTSKSSTWMACGSTRFWRSVRVLPEQPKA